MTDDRGLMADDRGPRTEDERQNTRLRDLAMPWQGAEGGEYMGIRRAGYQGIEHQIIRVSGNRFMSLVN